MPKTALISRLVFLQLSGLIIEVLPIRIEDRVDVVGKGLFILFIIKVLTTKTVSM